MNNNNNENPNARQIRTDRQIRYHWDADDEIMAIINSTENSPQTMGVVRDELSWRNPE